MILSIFKKLGWCLLYYKVRCIESKIDNKIYNRKDIFKYLNTITKKDIRMD